MHRCSRCLLHNDYLRFRGCIRCSLRSQLICRYSVNLISPGTFVHQKLSSYLYHEQFIISPPVAGWWGWSGCLLTVQPPLERSLLVWKFRCGRPPSTARRSYRTRGFPILSWTGHQWYRRVHMPHQSRWLWLLCCCYCGVVHWRSTRNHAANRWRLCPWMQWSR